MLGPAGADSLLGEWLKNVAYAVFDRLARELPGQIGVKPGRQMGKGAWNVLEKD
jgi:hypothetical protein